MTATNTPTVESINPATVETLASYRLYSGGQIDQKLDLASQAQRTLGAFGTQEFVNLQAVTIAPRLAAAGSNAGPEDTPGHAFALGVE